MFKHLFNFFEGTHKGLGDKEVYPQTTEEIRPDPAILGSQLRSVGFKKYLRVSIVVIRRREIDKLRFCMFGH